MTNTLTVNVSISTTKYYTKNEYERRQHFKPHEAVFGQQDKLVENFTREGKKKEETITSSLKRNRKG